MGRYSKEGADKIRVGNFYRWISSARDRHGDKFDYEFCEPSFRTQKNPNVPIICREHGRFFVLPSAHLHQHGGGCKKCGLAIRGESKLAHHETVFANWFFKNASDRLELVGTYTGAKSPIDVRCIRHNNIATVTPDRLMRGSYGCSQCAAEGTQNTNWLVLDEVRDQFSAGLPDSVQITDLVRTDKGSRVVIECARHGRHTLTKGALAKSPYGCPRCGNEIVGYAGYRIQRLLNANDRGRDTWIGIMEVKVFGISALKVGITTRSLEGRYRSNLKRIFFSTKMREIDVLLLENTIHRKFYDHHDLRILKKGMRDGKRWSGDTECYWFTQKQPIISFVKNYINDVKKKNSDYWSEFENFEVPIFFERDVGRLKSKTNIAVEIVGVDPQSGKVVKGFSSFSEAARNGFKNVSLVINEYSNRQISGGLRWFRKDGFIPHDIKPIKPKKYGKPVQCVETGELFLSTVDAERNVRGRGIAINASHITSVCKGNRSNAGGLKWQYANVSQDEVVNQDRSKIINFIPPKQSNAPQHLRAVDDLTGVWIGDYASKSEAARRLGICAAGNITVAMQRERPVKGIRFSLLE